jgi:cell division protein FtsQ
MRSVNAQAQATPRVVRDSTRSKAKSRTPSVRGGRRASSDSTGYGEALRARLGWFGSAILFRRPMLSLTAMLVLGGGIYGLFAGGHLSRLADEVESSMSQAGFAVGDISVAGGDRTSTNEVYAALEVERGQSIFTVDASEARTRLLDLPWVADAEVRRNLPAGLSIRLIEKRPFALWQNGKSVVVIERSGAIITDAVSDGGFDHLPVFTGSGAPEAAAAFLDAARPYRAVFARLQTIQRMGERRWDLLLAGGVTVKLPEEGWESQLTELESLIVEKAILERDIEMIDLRYPDNYVFKLHNGDSRPVSRERRA